MVFAAIDTFQQMQDKVDEKKKEMEEKMKKGNKKSANKPKQFKPRKSRKIRQREMGFIAFCLYMFIHFNIYG